VAQAVELLPRKYEGLSLNTNNAKKKKKKIKKYILSQEWYKYTINN
jgi:hypothetical protein